MGFVAPLIFAVTLFGLLAIYSQEASVSQINTTTASHMNYGQSFLAYRNAVMTYQQNNPSFTGTIPASTIAAMGGFTSTFLSQVSNVVVATGARNGRAVICYGSFGTGAQSIAEQASIASNNDVSFGISNGATWTSAAVGASTTAIPLATSIPAGNAVSVIEMDL